MLTNMKKGLLAAAVLTLAPVAPLLVGSASNAEAHTYVSGSVSFGTPVAVVGFSYDNPYLYGPVYAEPAYCDVGPVYYYPAYHVYAPYYPAFRYYSYSRPRYFYPHHRSYYPYGGGGYIRGHVYGRSNGYGGYGGHGRDGGRYRVRGHGWGH